MFFGGFLLEIVVYVKKKPTTICSGMKFCRSRHSIHLLILKPPPGACVRACVRACVPRTAAFHGKLNM